MSREPYSGSDDPELDPYEINFCLSFAPDEGRLQPFVNSSGIVIGDHYYESPDSPLSQWSEDTDPAVMAGNEWVHPFKDVGFLTSENMDYFERGYCASGREIFMHPDKNSAYRAGDDASENNPS